jgi:hypothetical protein
VIFEVWSPNNRQQRMEDNREFYGRYGAEEYYIVYPDFPAHIDGCKAEGGKLVRIPEMNGFISPRLKVRFELKKGQVAVYGPDGGRFLSFVESGAQAIQAHERAEQERRAAEAERQKSQAERQKAEAEHERAAKLAARLRELGVDPDTVCGRYRVRAIHGSISQGDAAGQSGGPAVQP